MESWDKGYKSVGSGVPSIIELEVITRRMSWVAQLQIVLKSVEGDLIIIIVIFQVHFVVPIIRDNLDSSSSYSLDLLLISEMWNHSRRSHLSSPQS